MICKELLRREETFELGIRFINKSDFRKAKGFVGKIKEVLFVFSMVNGWSIRYIHLDNSNLEVVEHTLIFSKSSEDPYDYELEKIFIKHPGEPEAYYIKL